MSNADLFSIAITQDQDAESPREWCNLGTLQIFHDRYELGDTQAGPYPSDYSSWSELEAAFIKHHGPMIILPVYMLDHSGLRVNTTGFHCPWDSGQVGFIFVTLARVREEFGWKAITAKRRAQIETSLRGEVETLDQYLTGDVWGYTITEDETGEIVDSCWGFYGRDECEKEAQDVLGAHVADLPEQGELPLIPPSTETRQGAHA